MRRAHAGIDVARVGDVVMVVPVAGCRIFGGVMCGGIIDKEAGTEVPEVAVSGGGGAPVFTYIAADFGVVLGSRGIEGLEGRELGGVE